MGLDLKKAFNRVSHEFLVVAMRQAGIPVDTICRVTQFLQGLYMMQVGGSAAGPNIRL